MAAVFIMDTIYYYFMKRQVKQPNIWILVLFQDEQCDDMVLLWLAKTEIAYRKQKSCLYQSNVFVLVLRTRSTAVAKGSIWK